MFSLDRAAFFDPSQKVRHTSSSALIRSARLCTMPARQIVVAPSNSFRSCSRSTRTPASRQFFRRISSSAQARSASVFIFLSLFALRYRSH